MQSSFNNVFERSQSALALDNERKLAYIDNSLNSFDVSDVQHQKEPLTATLKFPSYRESPSMSRYSIVTGTGLGTSPGNNRTQH
jgi:hypothetical protein